MTTHSLPECAIIDGGMGSELSDMGISNLDNDPLWSARCLLTNVEAIKTIHLRFLEAGADIIETATYQASVEGFKRHGNLSQETALSLVAKGVEVAREVRDKFWSDHPELHTVRRRPLVAGNVGPYGACQADGSEYTGHYVDTMSKQELMSWHRPHIQALLSTGAELLAVDTLPAQAEAEAITELLAEFPTARAWLSFSCKDGSHLYHGETLCEAVKAVVHSEQVFGIGINCSSAEHVAPLLTSIKPHSQNKVLVVYPNSGETWGSDKAWHGGETCRKLHEFVPEWWELGVRWFGGCCRIKPEEIVNIRQAVNSIAPGALKRGDKVT